VAPSGSDTASGASASPWRTLQKAANTVRAGDTVIVRAGTYAGMDLWTSGAAGAPIVFSAEPGVVVNTRNARTPDGLNLEGASHVVIEGFTVSGLPRAGIRSVVNHHVTIRSNTGDLNGRWGILTGFSDDLLIEGTTVPYKVVHAGGTFTTTRNHETGGGQWQLQGTFTFNAGTGGYVEVSDANGQAAADAVRLVPK
jgi:hypothetical protein